METMYLQPIVIALAVGLASGTIGSFIVLRRMALVGDALSHVALPGIALALAYHIDPLWGVVVFLLLAAIIIWLLEIKTKLPTDALVGILFTASLAIGILTIPDTEILESLFGEFPALSLSALAALITASGIATLLVFLFSKQFLLRTLSPEIASVNRVGRVYELILLLLFSLIVSLGIKLVGVLLMGALTIIPSLAARNISSSMKSFVALSAILGGGIAVFGVILSQSFNFLHIPGPAIILVGVCVFLASLIFVKE